MQHAILWRTKRYQMLRISGVPEFTYALAPNGAVRKSMHGAGMHAMRYHMQERTCVHLRVLSGIARYVVFVCRTFHMRCCKEIGAHRMKSCIAPLLRNVAGPCLRQEQSYHAINSFGSRVQPCYFCLCQRRASVLSNGVAHVGAKPKRGSEPKTYLARSA